MAASAALVVVMPIQTGVSMSIALSLLNSLYIIARPDSAVLARVPGTTVWWDLPAEAHGEHEPGVLVFAPGAPINFTNAYYLRGKLMAAIAAMGEPCRLVVIEANRVISVDFTGAQILQQIIADLRNRGIEVALARLESDRAQHAADAHRTDRSARRRPRVSFGRRRRPRAPGTITRQPGDLAQDPRGANGGVHDRRIRR